MDNKISIIFLRITLKPIWARTLDSVRAQTHRNIEVIVVNDGSKDGTGAVLDHYAAQDHRVKAIHKENGGVTSARLRGVAEATGEWIGFVDGDDLVEPALWNKLYRRALFTGITEKMDFPIKINEDVLMNYWLFKASRKSVYEDFCPYHYILRPGSAATSKLNEHKLRDPMKVTRAIFDDADEMLRPTALARLARQLIGGASMDANEQPELVKPYRRECRRELWQRLFSILRCSAVGSKLKLMALGTAICPWGYGLVHQLYARARGLDKIYDIK